MRLFAINFYSLKRVVVFKIRLKASNLIEAIFRTSQLRSVLQFLKSLTEDRLILQPKYLLLHVKCFLSL